MSDIPIIFSAPMVRALLDGRKTMTRRLAWRPRSEKQDAKDIAQGRHVTLARSPWQKVKPGDRLWVRENMLVRPKLGTLTYACDDAVVPKGAFAWQEWMYRYGNKQAPSIHMPRWASRLTLVVTATKIERLQEISDIDAEAEGVRHFDNIEVVSHGPYGVPCRWSMEDPKSTDECLSTPRWAFANYWVKLHGQESWDANPEVVAPTFTVHKANIDALAEAA